MSRLHLFFQLFKESILFAFEALRVNKLRTLLSLLGITIGIFAIITVSTITDSLERKIRNDVQSLGNNVIYIQKWPWVPEGEGEYPWWKYMNRPVPELKELNDLQRKINTHEAISYVAEIGGQTFKNGTSSVENCTILCVSHNYDHVKNFDLEDGRYFSEMESTSGRPIALLGAEVKEGLFGNKPAVGNIVTVKGAKLFVIGILKKQGSSMLGNTNDNNVIIPVNYARNLVNLKSDAVDPMLIVKAKENVAMQELRDDLKGAMRSVRKLKPREADDFSLNEISLLTNGMNALFSVLGWAGLLIGGFSILVGGFGIANIMFVSVRERTNIIGIQKSLGSKNYFILLQFLIEAVMLCIFGGLIGLLLVYILSAIASKATDFDLTLTTGNILYGITISAVIGILSGFIPAFRASKMNPVDAIRSN